MPDVFAAAYFCACIILVGGGVAAAVLALWHIAEFGG